MNPHDATAVLVRHQLLSFADRPTLLERLASFGGDLPAAAETLGLNREQVLESLAQETLRHAPRVKLSRTVHDPAALVHVSAGEAWDHVVLPLEVEADGTLVCCTTRETLITSLEFLYQKLELPFRVVLSDIGPLEQYIAEQYHYEGIEIEAEAA